MSNTLFGNDSVAVPAGFESDICSDFDDVSTSTTDSVVVDSSRCSPKYFDEKLDKCSAHTTMLSIPGTVKLKAVSELTLTKPLLIFDWDDTILPTSWLNSLGYRLETTHPIEPKVKTILDKLSVLVNKTFSLVSSFGHVMIVTNAEDRWIQLTVDKFMPKSSKIVKKFQHVSARSMYEPLGISSPEMWKQNAFRLVIDEYVNSVKAATGLSVLGRSTVKPPPPSRGQYSNPESLQVISIGDSSHERLAVLKVCADINKTVDNRYTSKLFCKSIKLMERPDIDSLIKQHQLIQDCFRNIVDHKFDLDLCIQNHNG